jgi:hypothetical protein
MDSGDCSGIGHNWEAAPSGSGHKDFGHKDIDHTDFDPLELGGRLESRDSSAPLERKDFVLSDF